MHPENPDADNVHIMYAKRKSPNKQCSSLGPIYLKSDIRRLTSGDRRLTSYIYRLVIRTQHSADIRSVHPCDILNRYLFRTLYFAGTYIAAHTESFFVHLCYHLGDTL